MRPHNPRVELFRFAYHPRVHYPVPVDPATEPQWISDVVFVGTWEEERAAVLCGLRAVDYVIVFDEDTPLELITAISPDLLVKGGDWPLDQIVGRDVVEAAGGRAQTIPFVEGKSTTSIVERILTRLGAKP